MRKLKNSISRLRVTHLLAIACLSAAIVSLRPVATLAQTNASNTASDTPETATADRVDADSEILVARLIYDTDKTAVCFADQFLATYARETGANVRRSFVELKLDSPRLLEHPFVLFSGQEAFSLSDAEKTNLKRYLDRGGFVLASAGCSNAAWAKSFESVIKQLYGEDALKPITTKHPLFHTVYDIDQLDIRRATTKTPVQAMFVDDRVRLLYSPLGLNDTGNAGGSCCCCGGSEIRNARLINVNALGYALTR